MHENQPLTVTNSLDATFEQWMSVLSGIYGNKNLARKPSEMWLRAVSDASKVGEAIRKAEPYEAMTYIVRTVSWVLTTTSKLLDTSYDGEPALQTYDFKPHTCLSDIVLSKYPQECPVCGNRNCHCPIMKRDVELASPELRAQWKAELKAKRRQRLQRNREQLEQQDRLPSSISGIAEMFEGIYGQVHYGVRVEDITFHFLEEIGEVAWCITNLDEGVVSKGENSVPLSIQLAEEIADVIAWSFAIIEKLAISAEQTNRLTSVFRPANGQGADLITTFRPKQLLPMWFWHIFYRPSLDQLACHACGRQPCECRR